MTAPTDPGIVSVTTAPQTGGSHAAPEPAAAPAANGSPLGALRDRRAKALAALYKDMQVPRWGDLDAGGPRIYVRFAAASPSDYQEKFEKLQKAKNKPQDWAVNANAQVLVSACMGIFAVDADVDYEQGDPDIERLSLRDNDPHGEWTKFDPDLAESLGLDPKCGAVKVVRGLYFTEGDVTSTANALLRWSGMQLSTDNADFSGS